MTPIIVDAVVMMHQIFGLHFRYLTIELHVNILKISKKKMVRILT